MGYDTRYSLEQLRNAISREQFVELVRGDATATYVFESDGSSKNWDKWYEHEEILCAWSTQHPKTLFRLHGEGENVGDIWEKYFFGGRLVHVESLGALPEPNLEHLLVP